MDEDEKNDDLIVEFTKAHNDMQEELKVKTEAAVRAFHELEELSERYGIPINYNGETYVPYSFNKKFEADNENTLETLNEISKAYYWRYSSDETYHLGWMSSNSYCS